MSLVLSNLMKFLLRIEFVKNDLFKNIKDINIEKIENSIDNKILLVEDNELNRRLFIAIIKQLGFTCDIAINGIDAVEKVKLKDYKIIFMDCNMPIMDGYEATCEIRKLENEIKHTHIVAMTANALEGESDKCKFYGMDEYISKPINIEKIKKIILEKVGYSNDK